MSRDTNKNEMSPRSQHMEGAQSRIRQKIGVLSTFITPSPLAL